MISIKACIISHWKPYPCSMTRNALMPPQILPRVAKSVSAEVRAQSEHGCRSRLVCLWSSFLAGCEILPSPGLGCPFPLKILGHPLSSSNQLNL